MKMSLAILAVCASITVNISNTDALAADAFTMFESCVDKNTSSTETDNIIRLMILTYSSHPALKKHIHFSPESVESSAKEFALYIEELLLIDCLDEAKAAIRSKGQGIIFQPILKQLQKSMSSLNSSATARAIQNVFSNHIDEKQFKKLLGLN